MHEHAYAAGLSIAALASLAGMAWIALSMPVHAAQALGAVPGARARRALRWLGASSIAVALAVNLHTDHASMAVLVWVMTLTGSALAIAFALSTRPHWLRVLEMGRPLAIGLGVPDGFVRAVTFGVVVIGVAVTTSVCGPISFVALLAGPISRRLMGRTTIVAAALVGAIITIAGDYVGAYLVPGDNKLPVGVITGLAGAPVLAWLLLTSQRPPRRSKGRAS